MSQFDQIDKLAKLIKLVNFSSSDFINWRSVTASCLSERHVLAQPLFLFGLRLRRYSPSPHPVLRLLSHVPDLASSNQSYLPCESCQLYTTRFRGTKSAPERVVNTKGLLWEQAQIWGTQKVCRPPYRVPGAVSGLQLLERHIRLRLASGVASASIY